jgi:uncharacterized repeat protein (TIGR04042 family)
MTVRWPDGRVEEYFSPSLVLHDHLRPGVTYTVEDFTGHARTALDEGSDRVRAKYGFDCTSAAESASRIEELAAAYPPGATVEVLAMQPPLPGASGAPAATGSSPLSPQPQEP